MTTYRAYLINADDRVSSYRVVDADTDADALTAARQFIDGCDVEVWHLDRKIGRLGRGKKNSDQRFASWFPLRIARSKLIRSARSQLRNDLEIPELTMSPAVLLHICFWRSTMSKLGILGATALSLTLAVATPVLAQGRGGGGHGGGTHVGGMGGGMRAGGMAGGMHMGGSGFRGAQASIGAGSPAVAGGNFAGRGGAQFAQGGYRGGQGWRHHGIGPGFGFAAGLAAGSALGYGYGGTYDPYYYGGDYAYDDTYETGYPAAGYVVSGDVDPAYCAQRYRSYDPASGTYLGYDGLRHPCGQ